MDSLGVYIGRFQPFHLAHLGIALRCLQQVERMLFVLGSAEQWGVAKNPFTVEQRSAMISDSLQDEGIDPSRLLFDSVPDVGDDQKWCALTTQVVEAHYAHPQSGLSVRSSERLGTGHPILFGAEKDQSAYYLRQFPHWESRLFSVERMMNATEVRALYFSHQPYKHLVPSCVYAHMERLKPSLAHLFL